MPPSPSPPMNGSMKEETAKIPEIINFRLSSRPYPVSAFLSETCPPQPVACLNFSIYLKLYLYLSFFLANILFRLFLWKWVRCLLLSVVLSVFSCVVSTAVSACEWVSPGIVTVLNAREKKRRQNRDDNFANNGTEENNKVRTEPQAERWHRHTWHAVTVCRHHRQSVHTGHSGQQTPHHHRFTYGRRAPAAPFAFILSPSHYCPLNTVFMGPPIFAPSSCAKLPAMAYSHFAIVINSWIEETF